VLGVVGFSFSSPRCLPHYASFFPTWLTNVFRAGCHWRSSQGGRGFKNVFFPQIPEIGSPALISIQISSKITIFAFFFSFFGKKIPPSYDNSPQKTSRGI
jgi:hypothetical protein